MDQREVVIYTRDRSLSCWRAKRLLWHKGYAYDVVDGRPVGGFAEIKALHRSGALDRLARGEV
jgi:hypothetical protein